MSIVDVPTELRVEHLLNSVKQLSSVELDEFTKKLAEWQQQKDISVDKELDVEASDDEVIAFIKRNLKLPEKEDRRYWQLRRKREIEDLSDYEFSEYQDYIKKMERMDVKRLEALVILKQRWGKPVNDIMVELGLLIDHFEEPYLSEDDSQECHTEIKVK